MKVLLANYRYFVSGGPERYMFNVSAALTSRGHRVIPFSIRYPRNEPTPFAEYFVRPLGGEDEVLFREQRRTIGSTIRTMSRLFYAGDVEGAVLHLVKDTHPEIAYILHYLRKLSPALLVGLKKAGLPIVVRLSDYAMVCPQGHCLRDGSPCELCATGDLLPSIRYRCVQHSVAASMLNAAATWYHRFRRYFDLIDIFVTTNPFMHRKMVEAGFPEERLRCIPTFVDIRAFQPASASIQRSYVAYAGRLEPLKGAHVLVDAIAVLRERRPDLHLKVKLAGSGDTSYRIALNERVRKAGLESNVEFLGNLGAEAMSSLLQGALLSVVPSLWYENLPNALLESYACGTPVIASSIGSLPDCVSVGDTGFLFEPGNPDDLALTLAHFLDNPALLKRMSEESRRLAEASYSVQTHLRSLETLFVELLEKHRSRSYVRG